MSLVAEYSQLQQLRATLGPAGCAQLDAMLRQTLSKAVWLPYPGPQVAALESPADELFFGGAAGGGKSQLLLGAGMTRHRRSLIFRRQFVQLKGLTDEVTKLYRHPRSFNKSTQELLTRDGRVIRFGACNLPGDEEKYQGIATDLKGFDELPHFTHDQYRFLTGWTRSDIIGQRCRVIAAGNPPTDSDGEWVIRYWAPWLQEGHPNPAQAGELRYFTTLDDKDCELVDGHPFLHKGERITPRSRTFIPSRIEDNPYLLRTNYKSVIQALPEPLRSKMLHGDFRGLQGDNCYQVIPTAWVKAAQERWKATRRPAPDEHMSALGVDVARGGRDKTILAPRYGRWFDELIAYPGQMTIDGPFVAGQVLKVSQRGTQINVDVIGVGAAVFDALTMLQVPDVYAINSSEKSLARDRSGRLGFRNMRAAIYWALREALDPEHGDDLCLPPDPELLADLIAPRWELTAGGILVESKEDIKERIGRSPDKGDAVIYAHVTHDSSVASSVGHADPYSPAHTESPTRWNFRP